MVRNRIDKSDVLALTAREIKEALSQSTRSSSIKDFYREVGMRNPSRSFYIRRNSRLHSLKAVVSFALQKRHPNVLARDFHAVTAARHLRDIGIEVVHNDISEEAETERQWTKSLRRSRDPKFRSGVIDLYGKCALSNCTTIPVLEAAHVRPVSDGGSDKARNGILLRADLHKLFDANQLAIDPTDGSIRCGSKCKTDYGPLCKEIRFRPSMEGPSLADFEKRWEHFQDTQ